MRSGDTTPTSARRKVGAHQRQLDCRKRLHVIANSAIIQSVNSKHRKTLEALFAKPTTADLKFSAIEALVVALGGEVKEGEGSRVALRLGDAVKHAHRPHPGKEARKYQIEEIRAWLAALGIRP